MAKLDYLSDVNASKWSERITRANSYYKDWENRFKCEVLADYYEGKHWGDNSDRDLYYINLIFSSLNVKRPALIFEQPNYQISPKPGKANFYPDEAFRKAQLKQDLLNSIVHDSKLGYAEEVELAILDSGFRFGIIEVGYGAEWIDNPNVKLPAIEPDYSDDDMPESKQLKDLVPEELIESEWIYVKRIPPWRFRVGGFDNPKLSRCSWVGYYDLVRLDDLRTVVDPKEFDTISWPDGRSSDFVSTIDNSSDKTLFLEGDVVKLWKIWDLRARVRFLFAESPIKLWNPTPFKRLPLFPLKFHHRVKVSSFYPIPLTYNWKAPQDEINEAREMMRAHRRKARTLYQYKEGSMEEDEADKIAVLPDQSAVKTLQDDALKVVPQGNLDASVATSMVVSKEDFLLIAGTPASQVQASDRQTATFSNYAEQRATVREDSERAIVAKWLCAIGKEILLQAREKLVLPVWIKSAIDIPDSPDELQDITKTYQLIDTEEIGEDDFDVDIQVESLSPIVNDVEKRKLMEFMALIAQYPLTAISVSLIREIAHRVGYRNERVIGELAKMAQLNLMMQAASMGGGSGPALNNKAIGGNQAAQNATANATPTDSEEIRNNIGQ